MGEQSARPDMARLFHACAVRPHTHVACLVGQTHNARLLTSAVHTGSGLVHSTGSFRHISWPFFDPQYHCQLAGYNGDGANGVKNRVRSVVALSVFLLPAPFKPQCLSSHGAPPLSDGNPYARQGRAEEGIRRSQG